MCCALNPYCLSILHKIVYVCLSPLFLIIYLSSTVLSLPCSAGFSLAAASGGWSLVVVYRLLIVMAPLCRAWALGCTGFRSCAHRLSHCCSQALENRLRSFEAWAWLLHSIWNLRRTGIEPVSLALTGSFLSISHQGIPNT